MFFCYWIISKRLSQKMPHRPEVRRYSPQVRSVFHFCYAFWHLFSNTKIQSPFFCTFCTLQTFFVPRERGGVAIANFVILHTSFIPRERGGIVILLIIILYTSLVMTGKSMASFCLWTAPNFLDILCYHICISNFNWSSITKNTWISFIIKIMNIRFKLF